MKKNHTGHPVDIRQHPQSRNQRQISTPQQHPEQRHTDHRRTSQRAGVAAIRLKGQGKTEREARTTATKAHHVMKPDARVSSQGPVRGTRKGRKTKAGGNSFLETRYAPSYIYIHNTAFRGCATVPTIARSRGDFFTAGRRCCWSRRRYSSPLALSPMACLVAT